MRTIHIDRIKVTTRDNREFFGIKFIDSEDNSHTYIDFKIVDDSRLNDLLEHGCNIDVVSSEKYLISNSNIFTNGRNREIGQVNFERRSYSGHGFGGHFGDEASTTYMLAYGFSRMLRDDIKVYKLNGTKINFK